MLTFNGIKAGARRLLAVALFVLPFGFAFGAAAVEQGLSPLQAIMMSATVFAGASQFAILDLWHHPLPLLSIALTTMAVNARHLVFGAALGAELNALPKRHRLLATIVLSDANFADMQSARQAGASDLGILVGGGAMLWLCWVSGTVIGAIVGGAAGDSSRFGADVVMAAFFVTAIPLPGRNLVKILPMTVAALVSVATLSLLPYGWSVLAGALAGGVTGLANDR